MFAEANHRRRDGDPAGAERTKVSVDDDTFHLAAHKPLPRGSVGVAVFLALLVAVTVGAFVYSARATAQPWVLWVLGGFAFIGLAGVFGVIAGLVQVGRQTARSAFHDALLDTLDEACVVTDGRGRAVYANKAFRDLCAHAEGQRLPGVDTIYAGYPDIANNIYRLAQAAREGRTAREELRLLAGSSAPGAHRGEISWLMIDVRPLDGVEGGPGVLWRVRDVTADRGEQEAAFQELQHIIDYLDHSPAGFFSADADGNVQYINATLAGWLGLDLTQTTGGVLKLADLVHEDGARLMETLVPVPGGAQDEIFDLDFVSGEGRIFPARILHRVQFDEEGRPGASRSLVLNRSPGSDAADTLRAAEVKLARFFNNAPIGIALVSGDGAIRNANGAFARIVGKSAARGVALLDLVGEEARPRVSQVLEAAWEGRVGVPPVEVMFAGEATRSGQFYASRIEEEGEDGPGLIVYAIDTSQQRSLELQFAQSQKMQAVGQLAGGVAHDFNNVLTAVIGFSDLLLARHRPTDPSFQDIMNIKQNANRAANLVRQLLAFSRRQTLRPEVMLLTDVLADLGNLLGRLLGEQVELKIVHGRELWPVKVDLNQFEQVIINLAVNARDAMNGAGSLSIRTANVSAEEARGIDPKLLPAAEYVLCEISDNGCGMTQEVLEKIYEPFFSTKEVGKGTGLGLSTVYGIIKQTGGYIFADSEVGKGSVFRIYLPRCTVEDKPADAAPREEKAEARPKDLTGKGTVLLVEDEEAVRAFASRALASRGYEVHTADSGETALEFIDSHDGELDLVISDVVMPEMDGPTLLKELRKRGIMTKIIFISGYAEDAFAKNLAQDEKFTFLPKPFSLKQLAETVKTVLEE
jgi:two-component system cell cycle sensor histidine kinase/response regulator CckA